MEHLSIILLHLLPAAYVLSTVLYWRLFRAEDEAPFHAQARRALLLTVCLHTAVLLVLSVQQQRCPLLTRAEGLLFAAWILACMQLVVELLARHATLGVFTLAPVTACAIGAMLLHDAFPEVPPEHRSSLFVFHIVASLCAYVCFLLAAIMAGLYMALDTRLKAKRFDIAFRKLPSLEELDRLAAAWALAGCVALALGGFMGGLWRRHNPGEGAGSSLLPVLAVLGLFLLAGAARRFLGWRGIRHIRLVLLAFFALLAVALLSFLRFHGFYA